MAAETTIKQVNLRNGQRAERKLLVTVAEWTEPTLDGDTEGTEEVRELLGTRVEDSPINYNPDIQESTDILGNNYTDINKTQPSQEFSPNTVLGGSRLTAYLNDIRRRNALSELQGFTIYVITAFIGNETDGYECEKHSNCSITYDSIGGSANVDFPFTVHFSNKITTGTVDKIAPDFVFTADVSI